MPALAAFGDASNVTRKFAGRCGGVAIDADARAAQRILSSLRSMGSSTTFIGPASFGSVKVHPFFTEPSGQARIARMRACVRVCPPQTFIRLDDPAAFVCTGLCKYRVGVFFDFDVELVLQREGRHVFLIL